MQLKMSFGNKQRLSEMSKKNSKRNSKYEVIVFNDDTNTFDHVIDCLMEFCGHNYLQAVQCATLVHQKSKCSIVVDTWDECEIICTDLAEQGLTVTISKFKKNA